jgi:ferric-dicitrate binding protein FerR (iron transport regulator)
MSKQRESASGDDAGIEELLRHVGARDEPSADLMNEVQQAVHAEWRVMLAERSRHRRTLAFGLAASIALVVVVATASFHWLSPDRGPVATIARIDGSLELAASDAEAPVAARVGRQVAVGETLRTDARTRIALVFNGGPSLRIDAGSTVEFAAPDRLVLNTGAVYIDSDPSLPHNDDSLEVETRAGVVRHLGTQYQIRQDARVVVISIREGRVEIAGSQGANRASAGEVLRISSGGSIERTSISSYDASWRWAVDAAPPFDIDNQPLSSFLNWVARETGKRIVYASAQAQKAAQDVVLRGSIAGLNPESSLSVVLSTTELRRFKTNDESIGIELAAPIDSH